MKFAISATALATLALSLIPGADATWGYHRPAYKEKSGTCRTLLGRPGFYYKVGLSTLCVPDAWRCGADGVECNNKPSVDYCPAGTSCRSPSCLPLSFTAGADTPHPPLVVL